MLIAASTSGPDWTQQVTAIASIIAGLGVLGVLASVCLAKRSLKATLAQVEKAAEQVEEAEKIRHISLTIEMADRWHDPVVAEVRRSLEKNETTPEVFSERYKRALDDHSQDLYDLRKFADFFEDFGTLASLDCLDLELINTLLGPTVIDFWDMWAPAIESDPKRDGLYENWEHLAEELREMRSKPAPPVDDLGEKVPLSTSRMSAARAAYRAVRSRNQLGTTTTTG